jgi:hypothetical protein
MGGYVELVVLNCGIEIVGIGTMIHYTGLRKSERCYFWIIIASTYVDFGSNWGTINAGISKSK